MPSIPNPVEPKQNPLYTGTSPSLRDRYRISPYRIEPVGVVADAKPQSITFYNSHTTETLTIVIPKQYKALFRGRTGLKIAAGQRDNLIVKPERDLNFGTENFKVVLYQVELGNDEVEGSSPPVIIIRKGSGTQLNFRLSTRQGCERDDDDKFLVDFRTGIADESGLVPEEDARLEIDGDPLDEPSVFVGGFNFENVPLPEGDYTVTLQHTPSEQQWQVSLHVGSEEATQG